MTGLQQRINQLIFGEEHRGKEHVRRFTQDSPVLPDVWPQYAKDPTAAVDLLLMPHRESDPATLCVDIRDRLGRERKGKYWQATHTPEDAEPGLSLNESHVVVRLWFDELIRAALPLTRWWNHYLWPRQGKIKFSGGELQLNKLNTKTERRRLARLLKHHEDKLSDRDISNLIWFVRITGNIEWSRRQQDERRLDVEPTHEELVQSFVALTSGILRQPKNILWSVNYNRPVEMAVTRSVPTTKADAAVQLFHIECGGLRWAIVDSGVDATHIAFRKRKPDGKPVGRNAFTRRSNHTRVVRTYDFTRVRTHFEIPIDDTPPPPLKGVGAKQQLNIDEFRNSLRSGRLLDWSLLEPVLEIPHNNDDYLTPPNQHGTHVAGILAGDWRGSDRPPAPGGGPARGVCPDLQLFDMRVIGRLGGSEDAMLAALQFIRYLNSCKDQPVIHGVNISMSLTHMVESFACGRTPICDECERLIASGVVVVAAAGNKGVTKSADTGRVTGYQDISITDPGNAAKVITVGATHRNEPHNYGVSYFSSRGPTGDGRCKPDLVAPGEKITAPIPGNESATMDGTSMAAPHVSGAAALLLARHTELLGQPARVKQILCDTATDLGRERYFQGNGLVDILRAIQSV